MKKYILSLAFVAGFAYAGDDVRTSLGDKLSTLVTPEGIGEIFELGFGEKITHPQQFFYNKISALRLNRQELEALRDGNTGPITMTMGAPAELQQKCMNMIFDAFLRAIESIDPSVSCDPEKVSSLEYAANALCKIVTCLTEKNMECGIELIFGNGGIPSEYWQSIISQAELGHGEICSLYVILGTIKENYNKRHALADDNSEEACKKRVKLDKELEIIFAGCLQKIIELCEREKNMGEKLANIGPMINSMIENKITDLRIAIAERCLAELQ